MSYINTNLNPSGRSVGDCVKRALAMATGYDYRRVEYELTEHRKNIGAKGYNEIKNCEGYVLNSLGAKKLQVPKGITVKDFCKNHPQGRYVLDLPEHWTACIDGTIYDTWDCSYEKVNHAYDFTGLYIVHAGWFFKRDISDGKVEIIIWKRDVELFRKTLNSEDVDTYISCLCDLGYYYSK